MTRTELYHAIKAADPDHPARVTWAATRLKEALEALKALEEPAKEAVYPEGTVFRCVINDAQVLGETTDPAAADPDHWRRGHGHHFKLYAGTTLIAEG